MAKSWKERREEEARILAEMEEAMQAQAEEGAETEEKDETQEEKKVHCAKCGNYMNNGVCPACGHRIYVPMDEDKQKTVRLIVGAVCISAFLLVYFIFNK